MNEPAIPPEVLALRQRIQEARAAYYRGQISVEELYAIADDYIDYLKDYRKRTGKRFVIPSRSKLIRNI